MGAPSWRGYRRCPWGAPTVPQKSEEAGARVMLSVLITATVTTTIITLRVITTMYGRDILADPGN